MTTGTAQSLLIEREEGTSFTVRLHPAGTQAPVVLIVPAMGVQAGYYGKLATALGQAGLSVAVTELRGHEESGGRTPSRRYDFGYAELVDDLGMAIEEVRRQLPGAPIHLLGHSLGGHLGVVYAAQRPGVLSGLMLVASGSVWWRLWHRRMYLVGVAVRMISAMFGYFPGHRIKFGGREARRQMRDWSRFNRTGRLEFGSPRIDYDPAIAAARLPVLGVSIAADTFSPPRALHGLLDKLPRAAITRMHLGADLPNPPGHLRWARRPQVVAPHLASWIMDQTSSASAKARR